MHTLFDLTWMAWTWPTAAFFLAVGLSVAAIGVWERLRPSGMPSRGVFRAGYHPGRPLVHQLAGDGFHSHGMVGPGGYPLVGSAGPIPGVVAVRVPVGLTDR